MEEIKISDLQAFIELNQLAFFKGCRTGRWRRQGVARFAYGAPNALVAEEMLQAAEAKGLADRVAIVLNDPDPTKGTLYYFPEHPQVSGGALG